MAVAPGGVGAGGDPEDGPGLQGVEALGLGDAGDAAGDVADVERPPVAVEVHELLLGLEERHRQGRVYVRVHERHVRAGAVVGVDDHVRAREDGHGAEEVVGILVCHPLLHVGLGARIGVGALQAHADPAHPLFEEGPHLGEDLLALEGQGDLGDARRVEDRVDRRARLRPVERRAHARAPQEADAGALAFGEDVGGDRGRPADDGDPVEEGPDVGEAQLRGRLAQAVEEAHGEVVRGGVDLDGEGVRGVAHEAVGEGSSDVDVHGVHGQPRSPAVSVCQNGILVTITTSPVPCQRSRSAVGTPSLSPCVPPVRVELVPDEAELCRRGRHGLGDARAPHCHGHGRVGDDGVGVLPGMHAVEHDAVLGDV